MAKIKHTDAKNDSSMANFILTNSGQALIVRKPDGTEQSVNQGYLTKQELYDDITNKNLYGDLRGPTGIMYDSVIVEFGNDAQYAKAAASIIINRFHKPNMTVNKNQGSGQTQTKVTKGSKEVLYDLHQEPNGDFHLHVLVSRYSIDNKSVEPQIALTDKYVRDNFYNAINADLVNANLAPLQGGFTTGITTTNSNTVKPSIATQAEVKGMVNELTEIPGIQVAQDVAEALDKIDYSNASISETVIDEALVKAEKELATLVETAKRKGEELKQLHNAKLVKQQNNSLQDDVKELKENLNTLNTELTETRQELKEKTEVFNSEKENLLNDLSNSNNNVITLQDKLAEKENEIAEFTELLATSEEEIEQKNTVLAQLNSERDIMLSQIEEMKVIVVRKKELEKEVDELVAKSGLLVSQNELKDATIAAKTNQIETQAQRNDELVEQNKTLRKQQEEDRERIRALEVSVKEMVESARAEREQAKMLADEQQKQITKLQDTVNNTEKENSLLREFVIAIEKRLEQASKVISTLSTKIKSTANKSFLKDFVESANVDGKEAVKAMIDEDTEKKMEKLAQLRAQFNAKAQSVAKFANDIKKDDEDKNQSRPGGPKKPT